MSDCILFKIHAETTSTFRKVRLSLAQHWMNMLTSTTEETTVKNKANHEFMSLLISLLERKIGFQDDRC